MDQQERDALAQFADDLMTHVGTLRQQIPELVSEAIKARADVVAVIGPTSKRVGSSTLADAAHKALAGCASDNKQVIFLTTKVDGILQVHKQAMHELSYVSNELSLIEEGRPVLTSAKGAQLASFRLIHQLIAAEWKLDSSIAVAELYGLVRAYHRLLLAFTGKKPGRRFGVAAAGKELADKIRDAVHDGFVFPGYSKAKRIIKAFRTSPAMTEAQELLKAESKSQKMDALNRGLARLDLVIEHADRAISESGKALIASSDTFDQACAAILLSLRPNSAN